MLVWRPGDVLNERPSTRLANSGDPRPARDDRPPARRRGGGAILPRPLHPRGARDDGASVGGGEAARRGADLPRGRGAGARVDGDGDARGSVAEARRGRLPARDRAPEASLSARLTIAIPAKGRLREPAVALLEDAGLGPEAPGERALAFPCRNAPVDVLLVRAADVPEYVHDGVVDCGITGADLARERAVEEDELLRLGFGTCRLEAAVPEESTARTLDDLTGLRVATVFPRLAAELLPGVELIEV